MVSNGVLYCVGVVLVLNYTNVLMIIHRGWMDGRRESYV
jgi:hypothetical protein